MYLECTIDFMDKNNNLASVMPFNYKLTDMAKPQEDSIGSHTLAL